MVQFKIQNKDMLVIAYNMWFGLFFHLRLKKFKKTDP